jgi:hypothetical protein
LKEEELASLFEKHIQYPLAEFHRKKKYIYLRGFFSYALQGRRVAVRLQLKPQLHVKVNISRALCGLPFPEFMFSMGN